MNMLLEQSNTVKTQLTVRAHSCVFSRKTESRGQGSTVKVK